MLQTGVRGVRSFKTNDARGNLSRGERERMLRLRLRLARALAEQLRLLECGLTWRMMRQREVVQEVRTILTVLHQQLLVVDDGDVLLRQVADIPVLDLPQLLGDLRDET